VMSQKSWLQTRVAFLK